VRRWYLFAAAALAVVAVVALPRSNAAAGSAVVTDGKFTNIYVYPNPDEETWEQHIATLRPHDSSAFSRASIDGFMARLMAPAWPSYFDALFQYNGIRAPRFFGSGVASRACVNDALRDRYNGVMQWDTVRTLANCHTSGLDPSPQVNLIFSPDIAVAPIAPIDRHGPEMCSVGVEGWHAWGLNVPNFTALPTSTGCAATFAEFTRTAAHEVVEAISDPAGLGQGDFPTYTRELVDECDKKHIPGIAIEGYAIGRYWSDFDNNCQPRLDPPAGSVSETWVLGESAPLVRMTGKVHQVERQVPVSQATTNAQLTRAILVVQTGGDDLRGGKDARDNAEADLNFAGGYSTSVNINGGRTWSNRETHAVELAPPETPIRVSDVTSVTLRTRFRGGISGDNWNVDKLALIVSFPEGSPVSRPDSPTVSTWLDASSNPLVRFTGRRHDYTELVGSQDLGTYVSALTLAISTGNDDLRGGSGSGDNADVEVALASGQSIIVRNVNGGKTWQGWSTHNVEIPIGGRSLRGGDVKSITVHTGFGGGIAGDNWNVNRIQLFATLAAGPPPLPPGIPAACKGLADEVDQLTAAIVDLQTQSVDVEFNKPNAAQIRLAQKRLTDKHRELQRCIDNNRQ